ncbi:hypothetical protein ACOI1C_04085 [Bacillus sp. DJP31]|uniref:hypothetical protein n=1 Tax=Bacillus sp. DJP31 TaxID=3409789 RepID=UPI003BB4F369
MVNQDFEKFNKLQKEHKSSYLGSDKPHKQASNDPDYNNNSDTDKSPGATGRDN